jgi:hypothetical protein
MLDIGRPVHFISLPKRSVLVPRKTNSIADACRRPSLTSIVDPDKVGMELLLLEFISNNQSRMGL